MIIWYNKYMSKTLYYKHKIENLLVINKIVTIHYFEFDKKFKSHGEAHDFWEMVYTDKEEIICTTDNATILLQQGEALFHKPNEFHTLSTNNKTAPNVFIISFECKSEAMSFFNNKRLKIKNELKKYIYLIIKEAKSTFKLPAFNPDLKKLELSDKPNLGGQQLIRINLEMLLIMLMRSELEKKNTNELFLPKEEFSDHLSNSIINLLENHIYENININEICKDLNYSKSFICTEFKKATGHTIINYFLNLKIDAAKKMIRETDNNFSQISNMLMFDCPNYFCKTFRRFTNMTPKQYKNSITVK